MGEGAELTKSRPTSLIFLARDQGACEAVGLQSYLRTSASKHKGTCRAPAFQDWMGIKIDSENRKVGNTGGKLRHPTSVGFC